MNRGSEYDVVIVGAGPNGLAAAVRLAEAGCSVLVAEAGDRAGGGTRTKELTLPGFRHDVCSSVHPLGIASPTFRSMPLAEHGLEWLHGEVEAASPLDDGSAAVLLRDLHETDEANGCDGGWVRVIGPLVRSWPTLSTRLLGPAASTVTRPVLLAQFAIRGVMPATTLARRVIGGRGAEVFAGAAAHANTSLSRPLSSIGGLVLAASAHVSGWPVAKGGSQAIADALVSYLGTLGGKVEIGWKVRSLDELPPSRAVVFDTTPWQLLEIAGDEMPDRQARRWRRFRHGAASFKLDYALDGPMPWTSEAARRAITVHLGGTLDEIATAEHAVWSGRAPTHPYVLVAQQTLVDPSRAPEGKHTLWAYCHVPNGSSVDMSAAIERQFDRFAPGWRDLVLARSVMDAPALGAYNDNYRGGDIAGGAPDGLQVLLRPDASLDPYRTALPGVWLCSSSTPPGGGVHGLCGEWAARSVLRSL